MASIKTTVKPNVKVADIYQGSLTPVDISNWNQDDPFANDTEGTFVPFEQHVTLQSGASVEVALFVPMGGASLQQLLTNDGLCPVLGISFKGVKAETIAYIGGRASQYVVPSAIREDSFFSAPSARLAHVLLEHDGWSEAVTIELLYDEEGEQGEQWHLHVAVH